MVRSRVRIRFGKRDDLRWIGHRDLMRCMERMFRRAKLPLSLSQGFHPKPRMNFPAALAVGIEADDEVMEVELSEVLPAAEIHERLKQQSVAGLEITSVVVLPEGARRLKVVGYAYEAVVPVEQQAGLGERVAALWAAASCLVERAAGRAALNVRPQLAALSFREGCLQMRLRCGEQASAGPRDVLAALGLPGLERSGGQLRRTAVEIENELRMKECTDACTQER